MLQTIYIPVYTMYHGCISAFFLNLSHTFSTRPLPWTFQPFALPGAHGYTHRWGPPSKLSVQLSSLSCLGGSGEAFLSLSVSFVSVFFMSRIPAIACLATQHPQQRVEVTHNMGHARKSLKSIGLPLWFCLHTQASWTHSFPTWRTPSWITSCLLRC